MSLEKFIEDQEAEFRRLQTLIANKMITAADRARITDQIQRVDRALKKARQAIAK